jgi:hypothetical protein
MTRSEAKAWRLMGDAFARLLRSDRSLQGPLWQEAYAVADWLYEHALTRDQQHEFMTQTGWVLDAKLFEELRGPEELHGPQRPQRRTRPPRDEDIPF